MRKVGWGNMGGGYRCGGECDTSATENLSWKYAHVKGVAKEGWLLCHSHSWTLARDHQDPKHDLVSSLARYGLRNNVQTGENMSKVIV